MRGTAGSRDVRVESGNRWSRRSEGPYDCPEEIDEEGEFFSQLSEVFIHES